MADYKDFFEITTALEKAYRNYEKKSDAYWKAGTTSRARSTTLYAKKEIANEWLGKCEKELETFINDRVVNGVFSFSYLPKSKIRK